MFYIDINAQNIIDARARHAEEIIALIKKRIGRKRTEAPRIVQFLERPNHLDTIVKGTPAEMFEISELFWRHLFENYKFDKWLPYFDKKNLSNEDLLIKKQTEDVFSHIYFLNEIFDYKSFIIKDQKGYNAYDLANALDRNTCTYCNRAYTTTVIEKEGKKIVRPTLDHWFPKAQFPLLALSFYNLIPSCSPCNSSVKGAGQFNLQDHIHPYVDVEQNENFKFGYAFSAKLNKYRIFLKDTGFEESRSRKTLQEMYVDEIYNSHHAELDDILLIKKNYSKSYIESMQKMFGGKLTVAEVYRLLFGAEYNTKDFYKRPLSKFKSDILKQLQMIDDK